MTCPRHVLQAPRSGSRVPRRRRVAGRGGPTSSASRGAEARRQGAELSSRGRAVRVGEEARAATARVLPGDPGRVGDCGGGRATSHAAARGRGAPPSRLGCTAEAAGPSGAGRARPAGEKFPATFSEGAAEPSASLLGAFPQARGALLDTAAAPTLVFTTAAAPAEASLETDPRSSRGRAEVDRG